MGAIKAFSLWFPLSRLATLTASISPSADSARCRRRLRRAVVEGLGWRGMFSS